MNKGILLKKIKDPKFFAIINNKKVNPYYLWGIFTQGELNVSHSPYV